MWLLWGYHPPSASGFKFLKPRDEDGVINHGKPVVNVQYRPTVSRERTNVDTTSSSTSRHQYARHPARDGNRLRARTHRSTGHGTRHRTATGARWRCRVRAHTRTRRNLILVRKVRRHTKAVKSKETTHARHGARYTNTRDSAFDVQRRHPPAWGRQTDGWTDRRAGLALQRPRLILEALTTSRRHPTQPRASSAPRNRCGSDGHRAARHPSRPPCPPAAD